MIHLYDIGNSGYDKFGDVILKPLSGNVRQAAGGGYDLTMEVPIDAEGAWAHIVPGAIVKVPVPKETIKNAFAGLEADIYKTNDEAILREGPSEPTQITYQAWSSYEVYSVGDKVTYNGSNYKCTYFDATSDYTQVSPPSSNWWTPIANMTTGSAALCTLKAGTELYFVEAYDTTWYKMSTFYGLVGYVKISQLTYDRHVTPSEITDHVITEQLFRLQEPTVNTEKNTVSVAGQHVSYDLAGILVKDINISQAAPAMAISHIVGAFMMDYAGEIATDMVDDDNGTFTGEIKGKNGIYALLDPDNGIVGQFDAKLTRDNWDIFVMKKPEADPVCSIAYGKNVRGITWKRSSNDLITRIVPVAKNEAGEDLYLPEQWVDSELISDYPVIIMERLNVQGQVGKAKSEEDETTWTESDLLDEMRTKAGERFSVDKVDQIKVEVTVQLEQLGASTEYEWLKKLESLLLYDKVVVQDRRIGLSVTVDAVEIEYDIVKEKVTGLKLSNVDYVNGSSIAGYNVKNHSISADKLMPGVADQIVSRAVGTVPEFAQPFDQTSHMNSASQDGLVKKGSGQAGKVWKTDADGNPDWRAEAGAIDIIDSLTSTRTDAALSANQGKVLNDNITTLGTVSVNTTGWNRNFGTGYCRWVKYGKLVIADITCMETILAISTSGIFAFAPDGFKPKANVSYAQIGSWDVTGNKKLASAYANCEVGINTNGEVTQRISGAMPVGSAFHFQFIYEAA